MIWERAACPRACSGCAPVEGSRSLPHRNPFGVRSRGTHAARECYESRHDLATHLALASGHGELAAHVSRKTEDVHWGR